MIKKNPKNIILALWITKYTWFISLYQWWFCSVI